MFDKKVKFTKNFTSTTYGNVYIGRVMVVSPKQAQNLINAGLAIEAEEKKEVIDDGTNNVKRSKKPLTGRSKRGRRSN